MSSAWRCAVRRHWNTDSSSHSPPAFGVGNVVGHDVQVLVSHDQRVMK